LAGLAPVSPVVAASAPVADMTLAMSGSVQVASAVAVAAPAPTAKEHSAHAASNAQPKTEVTAKEVVAAIPAPADLLEKRLTATREMLGKASKGNASIQLFYTDGGPTERMEAFLTRAKKLGNLEQIYVLPIKLKGHDAFRVLYGVYANSEEARVGMDHLPKRYLEAFAPTLHLLDNTQNMP
jgi:septal ring-binding cell division protein DamX